MADILEVQVAYLFAADERLACLILAFDQLSTTNEDQVLKKVEAQ
jgi:hypothetical protein